MNHYATDIDSDTLTDNIDELEEPPQYRVYLINDDYTTMEFVVHILMVVFRKSIQTAEQIMLKVHREGRGMCGIYPRDVAETKVETVHLMARKNEFPLKCIMEEDQG
jgi:ATP-dependent Clp protease adaptor protein ClpS